MIRDAVPALLRRHRWAAALALAALAALFYAWEVPRNPPGFHIDEASVSYNAYTISSAGRDEHGEAWPLFFRAFGDYKNPTYVYLLAGLFKVTGPSVWAARGLSAAAGFGAAVLLGLLGYRISGRRLVGLLCAVSALLTPWLFEVSRVVMEVALYPLVLALFLLLLHQASLKPRWRLREAAPMSVALALLTYTYSVGRLLGPLLALGLLLFLTRERWKGVLTAWGLYLVALVPLFLFGLNHPGALTRRFEMLTYATREDSYLRLAADFVSHYLGNLNPWRLLVTGDPNPDQVAHIFGTPHLLAATAALAVAGLFLVVRRHRQDPWWRFVVYGLLASVVPASLTDDYVHMLRLAAVPVFLLVLSVPALALLASKANDGRAWRLTLTLAVSLTVLQGAAFRWQFHSHASAPRRLHLFDAGYPGEIFDRALASTDGLVYLADTPWIPGYIQAYWHATIRGVGLSRFVLLPPAEPAPEGALVITTEEICPRCRTVATSGPYTLYVAQGPPRRPRPLPPGSFRAEIGPARLPERTPAGQKLLALVRVKNAGAELWPARERGAEDYQIALAVRWVDAAGRYVGGESGRSPLLKDLGPGEEVELPIAVVAPKAAGEYLLEMDMLQDGVGWFGPKGSPTLRVGVVVD